mgnify:CR=1 FL=1
MVSLEMLESKKQQELKAILKRYTQDEVSVFERQAVDYWYNSLGQQTNKKTVYRSRAYVKYATAACFLIISLASGWLYYANKPTKRTGKELLVSSARGEQKKIILADGSEILLNSQSDLRVSQDFGQQDRKVILKGEALFKIAKDKSRPFIIQSGALKTRVVGTSFNIRAYPEMERIKVSVLSGKVMVFESSGGADKLLAKDMVFNHTISYDRRSRKTEFKIEETGPIISWKERKLYIDNASISDIAVQLKQFYNLEVNNLSRVSSADKYTIRFNNESMKSVLQVLTLLTKRKFSYQDHQINISKMGT